MLTFLHYLEERSSFSRASNVEGKESEREREDWKKKNKKKKERGKARKKRNRLDAGQARRFSALNAVDRQKAGSFMVPCRERFVAEMIEMHRPGSNT